MKNIIKQKAVYLALIFALGCVSCATTYFKGSDSSEIADNFYNVEFDGNRYNSLEQIVKFTYLKAAETALENGYNYFSRAFKEKAGIPQFEYINRIRIQKSCLLLKR